MSELPGWDAIDRALRSVYGKRQPLHFGTIVKWAVGGNDPLDGISVYKNPEPAPHWHYVSYGLSELYQKETEDAEVSGFGYELTFRLARGRGEKEPPGWAMNFMQNLARYTFRTGRVFAPGHHMDLNGPIALEEQTDIRAALFALDPQLGEISTPNGRVQFVQIVGITADELDVTQEWSTTGLLGVLAKEDPLLVTDLGRRSVMSDPKKARAIRKRMDKEGSTCSGLYNDSGKWSVTKGKDGKPVAEFTLGAAMVPRLARLLRGRILHGREFYMQSQEGTVVFRPAGQPGWRVEDGDLIVEVSPHLAQGIQATLEASRGTYSWPPLPRFTLKVIPSKIKDQDGKVIEVIG